MAPLKISKGGLVDEVLTFCSIFLLLLLTLKVLSFIYIYICTLKITTPCFVPSRRLEEVPAPAKTVCGRRSPARCKWTRRNRPTRLRGKNPSEEIRRFKRSHRPNGKAGFPLKHLKQHLGKSMLQRMPQMQMTSFVLVCSSTTPTVSQPLNAEPGTTSNGSHTFHIV